MKKLVVALLLLLLTVGAKPTPPVQQQDLSAYEIDVVVVPVEESAIQLLPHQWRNAYKCTAEVRDFATGAPRALVQTVVQPGKRGVETLEVNGLTIRFAAKIDANRESAVTEVVLQRADKVLLRQRSITRFVAADRTFRR